MIAFPQLGHQGRLGNQLFQIASTIGIARTLKQQPAFPADWMYRKYFSLPDEMFVNLDDVDFTTPMATYLTDHIDPRARSYLQDLGLFWPWIDEIREYFKPSELAASILQEAKRPRMRRPLLGVHVRRGDKVVDPNVPNIGEYFLLPEFPYYMRAIQEIDLVAPVKQMLFCSDDIAWCKENFSSLYPDAGFGTGEWYWKEHHERFGLDEPRDWIDLFLLTNSDYFVVTGSTFGIWAALLANVPPSHVIRPDRVYGPIYAHVNEDLLFHPEWKVIAH